MNRKIVLVFGVSALVLVVAVFSVALDVPLVSGGGTIYIRANGSVDPPTAPIQRDGNIYTFTGNIYDSIVVERDNIVVDGAGYVVQGTGSGTGIDLSSRSNVTIKNMEIKAFDFGIHLYYSSSSTIYGNNITNNGVGIVPWNSYGDFIYHNNFVNNIDQVNLISYVDVWDSGYPSGGNYWSDYTGADEKSGPNQDQSGSDGIGDTSYIIDVNNRDRYPLVDPFSTFDAGTWNGTAYNVDIVSNSTISDFQLNVMEKSISFNVTSVEGATGFCRVTIPNIIVQDLWQGNYTVLINGQPVDFRNWTDGTNTHLYFKYTHSTYEVTIVPELPPALILPLLMALTLITIILTKKKLPKNQPQNT